jgi:hypothetical protein
MEANKRNKDLKLEDLEYLRERMTMAEAIGAQASSSTEVRAASQKLTGINVRGNSAGMAAIDTTQAEFGRYLSEVDDSGRTSRGSAWVGGG